MKKLLLFSAIALATATAGAQQTVSNYFNVVYEGEPVENGGNIVCEAWDGEAGWFHCDIDFIPKNAYSSASFEVVGSYTGIPTSAQWQNDQSAWGMPSICWASGTMGNCEPTDRDSSTEFAHFTKGGNDIIAGQFKVQFHVVGEEGEIGPGFNPMDPSTWPAPIPPTQTSHYIITVTPTVEGVLLQPFEMNVFIGPRAEEMAGVDDIAVENDASVVYYDLSGRKIQNPAKGQIVIERQGSKARKVIM